ncbi:MAG: alpha/beta hydrolase-fold protein [Bacteroidota bacterium]
MLKSLWLFLGLLLLAFSSTAQLQIKVIAVPANTPAEDNIHIVGSFNNWNPADDNYILTNNGDGTYEISFSPSPGTIAFKFARGSWDFVEGNADGGFLPDRTTNYDGSPTTLELTILSWEDIPAGVSTAAANVSILDDDFYMPQLDRDRRIWLYLPPDYATSGKRYPVLYMHDGQNLFDDQTAFSGEWKVDESLNALHANGDYGIIVVGIENGGARRGDEYSPWEASLQGQQFGGEGDEYVDFIVNTLKPHIDSNYRTKPEREYTGIMGSSLGGLISHYAAIEYQEVFGKAGIFSPSFQYFDEAYEQVSTAGHQEDFRYYMLAGGQEGGGSVVTAINRMYDTLLVAGFDMEELQQVVKSDGQHSEWFWAREFPAAYEWLFADLSTSTTAPHLPIQYKIYPNPVAELLQLETPEDARQMEVELYNSAGQLMLRQALQNAQTLNLQSFPPGAYVLYWIKEGKRVATQKLIKQ